jgi:hypothetical protein
MDGSGFVEVVGHFALVQYGTRLAAVDLVARRVAWWRDLLADTSGAPSATQPVVRDSGGQGNCGVLCRPRPEAVLVQTARGVEALGPATGAVRWRRDDVPAKLEAADDGERVYAAEMQPGANGEQVARAVRALRLADGVVVPGGDVRACFTNPVQNTGRAVLLNDQADMAKGPILRLVEWRTGRDLWKREYPEGSVVLDTPNAPGLLGVLTPDNVVQVIDLNAARELVRLKLDPAPEQRPQTGVLLADAEQFYVGLCAEGRSGVGAHFTGALATSAPLNGPLYAFPRAGGPRRWAMQLPNQEVLVSRFDESPVVVCSALAQESREVVRGRKREAVVVNRSDTLLIDKRSGKLVAQREKEPGDSFHTLRLSPATGEVELIASGRKLRLTVTPAP